ncbi:unnamed protein product [Closterium sp. Naga37s-1]|nr:unnamed protein product [Closterium sp. Naga37s-1]
MRIAAASVVGRRSPPVSATATAAAKPPAPKTMSPPSGQPVPPNPDPPAPVANRHPPAAVVASPVAAVPAVPVVAAAPAAPSGDLALAAVSATTSGLAPAVGSSEAVQSTPVAPQMALSGQQRRPQSPDRHLSRQHGEPEQLAAGGTVANCSTAPPASKHVPAAVVSALKGAASAPPAATGAPTAAATGRPALLPTSHSSRTAPVL